MMKIQERTGLLEDQVTVLEGKVNSHRIAYSVLKHEICKLRARLEELSPQDNPKPTTLDDMWQALFPGKAEAMK